MKRVDMGKTYFKLNNSPESREPLIEFFKNNGFEITDDSEVRKFNVRAKDGLEFTIIWFRNLSHVRVGKWGSVALESCFDEIRGSYGPWADHDTYEFFYNGSATMKLAIGKEEVKS